MKNIIDFLYGEKPPANYICDGCSFVPDLWLKNACVLHDYQLSSILKLWNYYVYTLDTKYKNEYIRKRRIIDNNFLLNMLFISSHEFKNQILSKKYFSFKFILGFFISFLYYFGVSIYTNVIFKLKHLIKPKRLKKKEYND